MQVLQCAYYVSSPFTKTFNKLCFGKDRVYPCPFFHFVVFRLIIVASIVILYYTKAIKWRKKLCIVPKPQKNVKKYFTTLAK